MTTATTKAQPKQRSWRLTLQLFTAVFGGYLFVNTLSIFFATLFTGIQAYAVAYGLVFGMLVWALIILWVFASHSLIRMCGLIWLATLLLAGLSWLLKIST